MPQITFQELPPVIQAIYAPTKNNRVTHVTVSLDRNGKEAYTIRSKDGYANRWEWADGEWTLVKEWLY